jgi:hypothetical protein
MKVETYHPGFWPLINRPTLFSLIYVSNNLLKLQLFSDGGIKEKEQVEELVQARHGLGTPRATSPPCGEEQRWRCATSPPCGRSNRGGARPRVHAGEAVTAASVR